MLGPPDCLGDLNLDRQVNLADLAIMLGHFGGFGSYETGDLDDDGDIDTQDLTSLLGSFGVSCP